MFYEDLGQPVVTDGLPGVVACIDAVLKDRRPGVLVIDSFKALAAFSTSEADYRRFLHEVAGRLSATAVLAIWIGEYDRDDSIHCPEFAVADGVLYLGTRSGLEREMRVLSVLKQRGSDYSGGQHAYRITAGGLRVFPRLADPQDLSRYALGEERASTGIPAMTWLRTPLRAFSISHSSIGPVFTRSISASIAASSSAGVLPGATVPMICSRPGPRVA